MLPASALAGPVDDVTARDRAWAAANIAGDIAVLESILADDFEQVTPDGRVREKADYLGEFLTGTRHDDLDETSDYRVRVYGRMAVMTHLSRIDRTVRGRRIQGMQRSSHVWRYEGGRWRCVHSHASYLLQ